MVKIVVTFPPEICRQTSAKSRDTLQLFARPRRSFIAGFESDGNVVLCRTDIFHGRSDVRTTGD
jgi:hypothetical protein